jgi:HK97 gp10 family phage protein
VARCSFKMPNDFLEKLSKLDNRFDEIAPKVLKAGAKPVLEQAKQNLKSRIGEGTKYPSQSSGELLDALEVTEPFLDRNDNWRLRVGVASTKDSKGVSNAMKAAIMEYGKSGQPPKPWLKPTKSKTRKACIEEMRKTLDVEIEKL